MKPLFLSACLVIGCFSCNESERSEREYYIVKGYEQDSVASSKPIKVTRPGYDPYTNQQYHFTLEYPKDWNIYNPPLSDSLNSVSFFPIQDTYRLQFPVLPNTGGDFAFISFYPHGLESGLPGGASRNIKGYYEHLPLSFDINEKESKVFLLENIVVYGYLFKPASPPSGWTKDGFIFAHAYVDGYYEMCIDKNTGLEKTFNCNTVNGDIIRKYGQINQNSKRTLFNIISSIHFIENFDDHPSITDFIRVSSPLPFQELRNPATITGAVHRDLFSKTGLPVLLLDKDYNILARSLAKAKNENSQSTSKETFLQFEVSMDYKSLVHDEGYVVLKQINASKKSQNCRSLIIPVKFSTAF